jgi:hypothetical protein
MPAGSPNARGLTAGQEILDLDALALEHFAAMEVHSRTSAPVQYKRPGDYCTLVLLWTRW